MNEKLHKKSPAPRWLLGGTLVAIAATLTFSRYAEAQADTGKSTEKKLSPARLMVDNEPIQRDGKFITSFSPVVKKVAPSVVNVFTATKARNVSMPGVPFFEDPFFRQFFGDPPGPGRRSYRTPKQQGLGSGVVVTEDGYILTNNHVVDNADEVKVAFTDGREFAAKVVGKDPKTDIAVLKIDVDDLPHVSLANSDQLEVGDLVLAVGNPFGVGQTVTMGMVSATGRATLGLDYEDFIQTDAAINPGNSGGALVDAQGRLVGINTAILSRTGGNQGIGFAVPVNLAKSVMDSLIKDGRVVRGFMGVNIQDLTPALAKKFGVKESATGALVSEVTPKSPAEKAGLQSGDIITQFNGRPVKDSRHLKLQVAQIPPGTKVPLKAHRDGAEKTLEVTLKEFPTTELSASDKTEDTAKSDALQGVTVDDIDVATRDQFKLPASVRGALVKRVDPDSAAYAAGLREGQVIVEINREKISDAEQAVRLSEKIKDGQTLLRVWSQGASRYLLVEENKVG